MHHVAAEDGGKSPRKYSAQETIQVRRDLLSAFYNCISLSPFCGSLLPFLHIVVQLTTLLYTV